MKFFSRVYLFLIALALITFSLVLMLKYTIRKFKVECNDGFSCEFLIEEYYTRNYQATEPVNSRFNKINERQYQPFDLVYVNLDRNTVRSEHMERLLNHSNLTYSRFRAVDGNQLYTNRSYLLTFGAHSSGIKLMEQKNNSALPPMTSMMKSEDGGRVGCWLSYLLLMLEIAASQTSQPVVILEDDVDVDANFAQLINSTIFKAPSDWDILLCGYCCMTPLGYVSNDFQSVRIYAATHCFIIRNATTAARIAQRLDTAEISSPVDLTLSALGSQRYINIYALINQIAVQRRDIFPSEIPTSGKIEQARLGNSLLDRLRQLSITTSTTTTVATTTTKTAANSTSIMINSINSTISDKKALTT